MMKIPFLITKMIMLAVNNTRAGNE